MNKRRLLKLADLLDADAKNKKGIRFDLNAWVADAGRLGETRHHVYYQKAPDVVPLNCNTAACAVGLACISGAFKRSGLSYTIHHTWDGEVISPAFDGLTDWSAVTSFFGISFREAEWLYMPGKYKVAKGAAAERAVAKRIRDFVAGKASPPGAE